MKRTIAKISAVMMSMSLLFPVSVFASETRNVSYRDEPFSTTYTDDYNVISYVNGTASADAAVGWDEGYFGWVISAYFPLPSVTIDGADATMAYSGNTVKEGSSAYQEFSINGSEHRVRPTVVCDEYGDTDFWVKCW